MLTGIGQPHTALPSPSPTAHPQPPSTGLPTITNTKGTHKPMGPGYALPGDSKAEEGKMKGSLPQLTPCLSAQLGKHPPAPSPAGQTPMGAPEELQGWVGMGWGAMGCDGVPWGAMGGGSYCSEAPPVPVSPPRTPLPLAPTHHGLSSAPLGPARPRSRLKRRGGASPARPGPGPAAPPRGRPVCGGTRWDGTGRGGPEVSPRGLWRGGQAAL